MLPPLPSTCTEARSLWGGVCAARRGRSAHASSTCSPQLSERSAYQARSEFCGAPHRRAPQAARSESAGTQVAGSPFLGLLSFGEAKESKSAVGPRPDFLPHHQHTAPTGNNKAPIPAFPQRGKELNPPHPSPLPQAGEGVQGAVLVQPRTPAARLACFVIKIQISGGCLNGATQERSEFRRTASQTRFLVSTHIASQYEFRHTQA